MKELAFYSTVSYSLLACILLYAAIGCDSSNFPCQYGCPPHPSGACIERKDWPSLAITLAHVDDTTFKVTLYWSDLSNGGSLSYVCMPSGYVPLNECCCHGNSKLSQWFLRHDDELACDAVFKRKGLV